MGNDGDKVRRKLYEEYGGAHNVIEGPKTSVAGVAATLALTTVPLVGTEAAASIAKDHLSAYGAFGVRASAWALSKSRGRLQLGTKRISFWESPWPGAKITVDNQAMLYAAFIPA